MMTFPKLSGEYSIAWLRFSMRSEEHTSELQSLTNLVCRLLLEKKKFIRRLLAVKLDDEHSLQIFGLLMSMSYITSIWCERSLTVVDAITLTPTHGLYLI